jgi:tRNA modification GTPase
MMHEDTIAAISTPLGEGGIGIVRMSGSRAISIAEGVFQATDRSSLLQVESHTLHHGFIGPDGKPLDEVLVAVMRAPRTYTREDVVEINCHGGIVATRAVLDLVLKRGARLAERGEFTKRAFLNGRISLDQAQAVLDIVKAKTGLGLEAAVDRLSGRFTAAISALRETIARLLADVEVGINFPDVESTPKTVIPVLESLLGRVRKLLAQGERGRIVREGLTIAIIGRPNVGKSTLLNVLLQEERAIVTPLPGTTRDTVEEEMDLAGVPVRVIDTAGLREAANVVEEAGLRRAQSAIDRADMLFLMLDRSDPLTEEDQTLLRTDWGKPHFLLLNKSDLPRSLPEQAWGEEAYEISAKTGEGIDRLLEDVLGSVLKGQVPSRHGVLLLDTWERDLLRRVEVSLAGAVDSAQKGCSLDMLAEDLRATYAVTGELQGIDLGEEILDQIFSRFCVGK